MMRALPPGPGGSQTARRSPSPAGPVTKSCLHGSGYHGNEEG